VHLRIHLHGEAAAEVLRGLNEYRRANFGKGQAGDKKGRDGEGTRQSGQSNPREDVDRRRAVGSGLGDLVLARARLQESHNAEGQEAEAGDHRGGPNDGRVVVDVPTRGIADS
jgi:hypothetical protein